MEQHTTEKGGMRIIKESWNLTKTKRERQQEQG